MTFSTIWTAGEGYRNPDFATSMCKICYCSVSNIHTLYMVCYCSISNIHTLALMYLFLHCAGRLTYLYFSIVWTTLYIHCVCGLYEALSCCSYRSRYKPQQDHLHENIHRDNFPQTTTRLVDSTYTPRGL